MLFFITVFENDIGTINNEDKSFATIHQSLKRKLKKSKYTVAIASLVRGLEE